MAENNWELELNEYIFPKIHHHSVDYETVGIPNKKDYIS